MLESRAALGALAWIMLLTPSAILLVHVCSYLDRFLTKRSLVDQFRKYCKPARRMCDRLIRASWASDDTVARRGRPGT